MSLRIHLPLIVIASIVTGCSSSPSVENLVTTTQDKCINISQAITYRVERPGLIEDGKWDEGLLPGVYRAEKENSDGVFYRTEGRPVIRDFHKYGKFSLTGGIWIPVATTLHPRLYFYGEPQVNATDSVNQMTQQATNNAVVQGANPATTSAGYSIGGAIITAIIESDWGKIRILDEIQDPSFIEKISTPKNCPEVRSAQKQP